jgi:hypothetical protein
MSSFIAQIQALFQPEEISGGMAYRAAYRWPVLRKGPQSLSLKAVFWCAAAILLSLALGNLT